jgi:hypothetical protein
MAEGVQAGIEAIENADFSQALDLLRAYGSAGAMGGSDRHGVGATSQTASNAAMEVG